MPDTKSTDPTPCDVGTYHMAHVWHQPVGGGVRSLWCPGSASPGLQPLTDPGPLPASIEAELDEISHARFTHLVDTALTEMRHPYYLGVDVSDLSALALARVTRAVIATLMQLGEI